MNNFRPYIFYGLSIVTLILSSCQKVIDLNLDQTSPKLVIEATITNNFIQHSVSLSETVSFDASTRKMPVSGAVVVLNDENGSVIRFTEQGQNPGQYRSPYFRGIPGRKYTLNVTVNGKTYTASSVMPSPVPIESLNLVNMSFFGEIRKMIEVNYMDPAGEANYYYSRIWVNDIRRDQFFVDSDRFTNGREVKNTLFIDEPYLKNGDEVSVQMFTIDEHVYRYLYSITQITGNGGPPTVPTNPVSNFNHGALGYFSASTVSQMRITIK